MSPTTDTQFTLDQMHGVLKTLGIAAANLWAKTRKLPPQSAVASATEEELLSTLTSMRALLDSLIPIHEEVK